MKSGSSYYIEGCASRCSCYAGVVECLPSSCGEYEHCGINPNTQVLDCLPTGKYYYIQLMN